MRHFYCHQQGFLDARRYNQVTEHEVSVIVEDDGLVSKNRYGLTGIKLDRGEVNLLYSLSLNQIEAYFRDLRE